MKFGDKSGKVGELQRDLKALGFYHYTIDNDFGPLTKKAVEGYQSKFLVNGIVDDYLADRISKHVAMLNHGVRPSKPPHGMAEVRRKFGVIEYEDRSGGRIKITNDWASENMTKVVLPVVGSKWIHKKVQAEFSEVLEFISARGYGEKIHQFGTWSPRHKMSDPNRPLSLHSWGIACDINWATNPPGSDGDIDPEIVSVFERVGFEWGGRWRHQDPMHFQFATGC